MNNIPLDFTNYTPKLVSVKGEGLDIFQHALDEGLHDRPSPEKTDPNWVEHKIINNYVDSALSMDNDVRRRMQTVAQEFTAQESLPNLQQIQIIVSNANSAALAARTNARDTLYDLLVKRQELWHDHEQFRQANSIDRKRATYPLSHLYHFAIIMVIVLIESVANTYFFAQGSIFGLIGGLAQSILVSVTNVGSAVAIGSSCMRSINHVRPWIRNLGVISLLAYIAFLLLFNLVAAHYRDLLAAGQSDALQLALSATIHSPFQLSFDSIMLLTAGIAAAGIGLYKGYTSDDPYPGYGALDRRVQDAEDKVASTKEAVRGSIVGAIGKIELEFKQLREKSKGQIAQLEQRREAGEALFGNYKTARESIKSECHQDLRRYREMNKQIRTSPAPVYFGTYPQFSDPVDSDELKAFGGRIAEARKRLSALEVDIDRANCDKEERLKKENDAFDKFIDDLTNAAASQVAGLPKPATSNS